MYSNVQQCTTMTLVNKAYTHVHINDTSYKGVVITVCTHQI